jgi:hypothetical protein
MGKKWPLNFAYQNLYHTSGNFLTRRKILRHGADCFSSPPKRVVLRILIALDNPLLSAGFKSSNLGFIGKQDIRYTTKNDMCYVFDLYFGGSVIQLPAKTV